MILLRRLLRYLQSAQVWIVLGVVGPLGMLLISGLMLLDLRRDTWDRAEQTSQNLLQVIERDIARNIEIYDLSLRGVVDNLKAPGLADLSPVLRQLILFDRAASASDMGVMLVLDESGNIIDDANAAQPRTANYADREYFQIHKTNRDQGLYISKPLISRLTGVPMIALSRRINKPDGSFGGVAMGTLKLSYFMRLFDRIGLGQNGAINLYRDDGTRIMRYPFVEADIGTSIAAAPDFKRFARDRSGSFTAVSVRDKVERHYAFTHIGDLPLILNVALATADIEAEWRTKAWIIGGTSLVLCGLTIILALWVGRELRHRTAMQAELARLSLTDGLTGLSNRRRFDEALPHAWSAAAHTGRPLSLLIVDADHFKRFNDRYGHQVGDDVLRGLARCLMSTVHRDEDLVCRLGGEEFALLLPETDLAGALRIAEKVHSEIAACRLWPVGIGAGAVTVSIGVASSDGGRRPHTTCNDLYRSADAALYEAKAAGRNQTQWTRTTERDLETSSPLLRIVNT
ncbi:sensor domain-containing diguanylate cyclase [Lichenifustis flavocetrariae]|uniref:diguanylate cyclase n=1 Tax=Lichenifustis flavocetrariae TaxID=2949735 RepID=A0AA41Z981_9HYPH|nr:sensor domain-containing diguanylate cyclase [Lichenifustis flavocetrariae]MCW6512833.1 sensor domain-containing diguanylate cyclase [Lichenifustis flavocetrariae]